MLSSSQPSITQMQEDIHRLLPRLTRPQARVLGEMVYGMLLVDGCGLTRICSFLSALLGKPMATLRQKYREMYYEKEAKAGVKRRGQKRREIVVEEHFADLLRGVLGHWQGEKTLVLAMDASTLSDRLVILSISVVYRGCGMRVAWTILPAGQPGAWRPHWERLLRLLAEAVPVDFTVAVMADRGLYAAWLFRAIQQQGWHPFLRVSKTLGFRQEDQEAFRAVGERVKRTGKEWKGRGEWSEKGDRQAGTLLVRWEQGYEEPICVVTDWDPSQARTAWYQMRFWIECEYKDGKRGWWHWEQTKMFKPERASRLWFVLAIVLQKAILLGGELEAQEQQARGRQRVEDRKRRVGRPPTPQHRSRGREQSVLLRGMMAYRAAQLGSGQSLPVGCIHAEALPAHLYAVERVPRSYHRKRQRSREKRRQRQRQQRSQTQARRMQRAERKAAQQAAQEAARLARRQERAGRQAAQQAARLARREEKQRLRATKEVAHQATQLARQEEKQRLHAARIPFDGPFPSPLRSPQAPPLPVSPNRRSVLGRPEPLLRLVRGRLLPHPRLLRAEIRPEMGPGPPQQAGP